MPDVLWEYDPTAGQTVFRAADGTLSEQTLTSPTGKEYLVTGAGLQDATTGQLVLGLGRSDVTTFNTFGENTLQVITPISWRQANMPTSTPDPTSRTPQSRVIKGTLNYTDSSGTVGSLTVEGVTIAPVGQQVVIHTNPDESESYFTEPVNVTSTRQLQTLPNFDATWRLANPDEVAEYAIGKWLSRHEPDILRDILRGQGVSDADMNSGDNYEIAALFNLSSATDLQAYSKTWVFG